MKIKCRRNTTSSSSSFPNSILTHLCPFSWLSKFKIKGGNHEINYHPTKKKQREKQDFTTSNSSFPSSWREARFYSMDNDDDDTYWRLSFSDCRRNACGVNTLWHDSDDEFRVPFSNYNMKKVKEKQHKKKFPQMKKDVNEQRSRKPKRRAVRKKEAELESFIFPMEPEKNFEGEKFTGKKGKTEFRRRRIKQNQARAYSSKTECRIRVLEDKLKARTKSKMNKKTGDEGKTVFDSFAVVKNSFNPQQDFRESMIEMIREKGIRWREELEELLAAYLTLNCDEYHDVIIKVFQQVWFEVYES